MYSLQGEQINKLQRKQLYFFSVSILLLLAFQNCGRFDTALPSNPTDNTDGGLGTDAPSEPVATPPIVSPPMAEIPPTNEIPVEQKNQAAAETAKSNSLCTALGDFYWEIGDLNGALGSGAIGTTYTATSPVAIASASKMVFGAFMIQLTNGNLTPLQKSVLRMQSGYHGLNPALCTSATSLLDCLSSGHQGSNFVYSANEVGRFHYDGAHDQVFATTAIADGGLGLGGYSASDISSLIIHTTLGLNTGFSYGFPELAGGIKSSPQDFAIFLRAILSGKLLLHDYLGVDRVCTLPSVCPTSASSPGQVNWSYSYNHWVEDDGSSDGSFSSPGAFGFYPWISADKTLYGVISRHSSDGAGGFDSAKCSFQMRKAWNTGVAVK